MAQDFHFSQMKFAPLAVNPALAGANQSFQGILMNRSQWRSVAEPFQTSAASIDARLTKPYNFRPGYLAGGIFFFNDNAGTPRISTTQVKLNLAYHLKISKQSMVGLGIYGGYGQRAMEEPVGRWGTQFDGFTYNGTAASGESFSNLAFNYFDAGAGLLYSYNRRKGAKNQQALKEIRAGIAGYHLNRPNHSFMDDPNEVLSVRISAFANAEIEVRNTPASFLPGMYYQRQGNASQLLVGTYYRYAFSSRSSYNANEGQVALSVGIFGRWQDALVGKLLLELDRFSGGMSYDITTSNLSSVSDFRGGMELFLRYSIQK